MWGNKTKNTAVSLYYGNMKEMKYWRWTHISCARWIKKYTSKERLMTNIAWYSQRKINSFFQDQNHIIPKYYFKNGDFLLHNDIFYIFKVSVLMDKSAVLDGLEILLQEL